MTKKLLFITPELPYPARSGGKLKSLKLLQALAERYEVTLACPLKADDARYLDQFHACSPCKKHLHATVNVPRSAANLLRSYARGIPLNVLRSHDRDLQRQIADSAPDYDLVMLDHYEVLPYLPADYQGFTVYHAHNAYYKMWQRFAQLPGNLLMRAAAGLEGRRVRRYETAVARGADMVFAAPNDGQELVEAGLDRNNLYTTYHLGDDSQLDLPALRYENSSEKLMYVGLLSWEANVQGLLWFIEQVWPRLLQSHPQLRFDIVGANPDQRLQEAVKPYPGITLTGYMEDLQAVYRDARVSVAPLLFGSGMKVKVLDAMARGIPTVTTPVGAEGIAVDSGTHLLVADDACGMAEHIVRLLTQPTLWQRLQQHSRALVRERYTWDQLFWTMHRSLDRELYARGIYGPRLARSLVQYDH